MASALVVGLGNTGGEIALDLWERGVDTTLSVRSPVHVVPRDLLGMPAQISSLMLFAHLPNAVADRLSLALVSRVLGDLSPFGLRRPEIGPITQVVEKGRIPLIDIGTVALIKQGKIRVVPGPRALTERGVVFSDGRELPFDVVVLATGHRPAIDDFLDQSERHLDERGYPRYHGAPTAVPGLFFIGFRNPLTGQLHDIAVEAKRVARLIEHGSS